MLPTALIAAAILGLSFVLPTGAPLPASTPAQAMQTAPGRILTSADELQSLPTSGPAWDALVAVAAEPITDPDLSDQDDRDDVRTLAKALVFARTGVPGLRDQVVDSCRAVMRTEGGTTLALGRGLSSYVLAADLVGLPAPLAADFTEYIRRVRNQSIGGRTLISTHRDRPNNWGTHAGASRVAVALFLGDTADLEEAVRVFRGWLGDRARYRGFEYGDLSWQADPAQPVGINPSGATLQGHPVGGVLPDDQRRGGGFRWPPPQENYVYEALQGVLLTAILLDRAGYDDVWAWEDAAIVRAFRWLYDRANYPAEGDDSWQPYVVNHFTGESFPTPPGRTSPGKAFGFTDWLYP